MSDLIDRDEVIEIIEHVCSTDDTYWKPGTLEKIRDLPTHPTPSNTLGALDCVSRQAVIDVLNRGLSKIPYVNNTDTEMIRRDERIGCIQEIRGLPSAQLEQKWETCFDCPLSHGCPKINGCTNGQTMEYASDIPYDCPISTQPLKGKWIDYSDEGYIECPFCHSATNCDGNKDELHYCFYCGAELR